MYINKIQTAVRQTRPENNKPYFIILYVFPSKFLSPPKKLFIMTSW